MTTTSNGTPASPAGDIIAEFKHTVSQLKEAGKDKTVLLLAEGAEQAGAVAAGLRGGIRDGGDRDPDSWAEISTGLSLLHAAASGPERMSLYLDAASADVPEAPGYLAAKYAADDPALTDEDKAPWLAFSQAGTPAERAAAWASIRDARDQDYCAYAARVLDDIASTIITAD